MGCNILTVFFVFVSVTDSSAAQYIRCHDLLAYRLCHRAVRLVPVSGAHFDDAPYPSGHNDSHVSHSHERGDGRR